MQVSEQLGRLPERIDLDASRERITGTTSPCSPLRGLSVVKAADWPAPVRRYAEAMADRVELDLLFDRAL
jgi:glutaredoxin 2